MPKPMEVTLIILWKEGFWEERNVTMSMPGGCTQEEAIEAAIKSTMSGLAAIGTLDKVKTMGCITGTMEVDIKEKKEADAVTR